MKILHVIAINGWGGAEKLLLQFLPELQKEAEIECAVFHRNTTAEAAISIAADLKKDGIPVYIHSYTKLTDKTIYRRIQEIVNAGDYDLIHSHLKYADTWLAWLKFRGKIRLPMVSTMHGYNDTYENKFGFEIRKSLFRSPYYIASKFIYKQFEGFILISKIVSDFFRDARLIRNKKQALIYHGYKLPAGIRLEIKEKSARFDIALPGRLIKRKGHSFAIEAIEKLRADYPNIVLHIYGDGPDRQLLEETIRTKSLGEFIRVHGYVGDLIERIRQSDLVLIPSLWEGFGLVFLDAFTAGVPVVAFDLPAANEIIIDGHNGLLSLPYSADSLADNIRRLYNDVELRRQLADNAYNDLSERFSLHRMVKEHVEFYRQVRESKRVTKLSGEQS